MAKNGLPQKRSGFHKGRVRSLRDEHTKYLYGRCNSSKSIGALKPNTKSLLTNIIFLKKNRQNIEIIQVITRFIFVSFRIIFIIGYSK